MMAKKTTQTPADLLAAALVPKEAQPYEIPANWRWVKLGSINQYDGDNIEPSAKPEEIFELYSVPSYADKYPEIIAGAEIGSSKKIVKKDDVLLCKINPRINRVWKVEQYTDHALIASSEWIIFRNEKINAEYLMRYFQSPVFREYMLSNVSGVGGSLMRAKPKYVDTYPVPLPPLAEQARIVARIETLFAQIDEAEEKLRAAADTFSARRAALLRAAFTGRLTAAWRAARGRSLDEWKREKLRSYLLPQEAQKPEGETFRYIDIDAIDNKHQRVREPKTIPVSEAPSRANRKLHANDVVFSMVRPYLKNIAYIDDSMADCIASTGFYVCTCNEYLNSKYLYHFLCADGTLNYLMRFMKGDNSPSIRKDDLLNLLIALPPLDEQREIVRLLDEAFAEEDRARQALEAARAAIPALRRAILARAFRGALGTGDPAEPPADLSAAR